MQFYADLISFSKVGEDLPAYMNATGARITRISALPEVVLAVLKDLEK